MRCWPRRTKIKQEPPKVFITMIYIFYIFFWIINRLMLSADSEDCEIDEQLAIIQGNLILITINKSNFR